MLPSEAEVITAAPYTFSEEVKRGVESRIRSRPFSLLPLPPYTPRRVEEVKGDITQMGVDAIVNAGNDGLLGCFRPDHRCVDNVIHRRAGPRLRDECADLLATGGKDPLVTAAYCLPCKKVVHVVGPVWGASPPSDCDKRLAKTYWRGLDAAEADGGIRTIAFPAISTGLFGFPKDRARTVVGCALQQWLGAHPRSRLHILLVRFEH